MGRRWPRFLSPGKCKSPPRCNEPPTIRHFLNVPDRMSRLCQIPSMQNANCSFNKGCKLAPFRFHACPFQVTNDLRIASASRVASPWLLSYPFVAICTWDISSANDPRVIPWSNLSKNRRIFFYMVYSNNIVRLRIFMRLCAFKGWKTHRMRVIRQNMRNMQRVVYLLRYSVFKLLSGFHFFLIIFVKKCELAQILLHKFHALIVINKRETRLIPFDTYIYINRYYEKI